MDVKEKDYLPYKHFSKLVVPEKVAKALLREQEAEREAVFATMMKKDEDEFDSGSTPEPAPAPAPTPAPKAKRRFDHRMIQSFDIERVQAEYEHRKKNEKSDQSRSKLAFLEDARRLNGKREIPDFGKLLQKPLFRQAKLDFPNMAEAIDQISEELVLSAAGRPEDFRFSPILLNGVPGIGKTALAMQVADILGVKMEQLNASGLQTGAQIVGTASHWHESSPSVLFRTLAAQDKAVFVLLLDEIDKVTSDTRLSVLPALLSLLEPQSAKQLKCAATGVEHDLSRLIIIATSNRKEDIDPALLSRFEVVDVLPPDTAQRKGIAERIHAELENKTRKKITLDPVALSALTALDCDLRSLSRAVRKGFSAALVKGDTVSRPAVKQEAKRTIGFVG